MKLSKKLVAMALTMALVIAQVSVLPFALENPYASGKSDSASYAMRVPTDEKVGYSNTGWFKSTPSIIRNADNSGYATSASSTTDAFLFIEQIGDERFFVVRPAENVAASTLNIRFASNPYNTYTSENPRPYNGIPASIPSTMEGMAFRVKGAGTASDKMYLNISVAAQGNGNSYFDYVVTNNIVFYDAVTGAQTNLTYDAAKGGILLPGNADGYIYAPLTGILKGTDALTYEILTTDYKTSNAGNNKGYRGIRYAFGTTDFCGKTLYIGDAFFVEDSESFDLIHAAPEAPELDTATETSIQVATVPGVVYAIDKGDGNGIGAYSTSGLFDGLTDGTTYKIYAKFDDNKAVFVSCSELATKGLLVPVVSEVTHNSIKVNVVAGQEYSIDGVNFFTTGIFPDLIPNTSYTITTREIANPSTTKTLVVTTEKQPYSHEDGDGAYYALKAPEDATKIDSSFIAATNNFGDLLVENGAIVFAPATADRSTVSIRGSRLTYGTVSGVSNTIPNVDNIQTIAVRLKTSGTVAANAKVGFAIGDYKLADGNYNFINVANRKQTTIYSYAGMLELSGALDGFLIIPLDKLETEKDTLTAAKLKTGYVTFDVAMEGDWANNSLIVNYALFLTDSVKFISKNAFPAEPAVYDRGKEFISFTPEKCVLYSLDEGKTWTDATFTGKMEGLTVGSTYPIWAKFEGSDEILKTTVSTRPANVNLVAPVIKGTTKNRITVVYVKDHEYSIEGTDIWNRTGVFENVDSGTAYYIVSRVVEETEISLPVKAVTVDDKYSSDNNDGSTYLYRIPNTDLSGNALPTTNFGDSYITKDLGAIGIGNGIGRKPATYIGADGDNGGAYIIKEFDGKKFIQFTPYGKNEASSVLSASMPYDGEKYYDAAAVGTGLLRAAGVTNIEAIAVRVKLNNISDSVGVTFYINVGSDTAPSEPTDKASYSFIDAKTGETSSIDYDDGAIKFTKENYDGWVIIPFDLYKEGGISLEGMLDNYSGVNVAVHGAGCSHEASWSKWADNTEFYMGETFVVSNMTNFIYGNAVPAIPEYKVKTATSINMVTEYGVEYSIDQVNWNMTGEFTGLTPNTKYTVYARYRERVLTSSLEVSTDLAEPPMSMPELISVSDIMIVVKAYGGLEYSYDGENWNETGIFDNLPPNTKFKIVGRNKVTGELTPALEVATPPAPNPYLNSDGFTSKWFDMSRYDTKYNEYWIGEHIYIYDEATGEYNAQYGYGGEGAALDIVTDEFGERFVDFRLQENGGKATGTSFLVQGTNTYDRTYGFPRGIWVEQCWGIAVRMNVEASEQDLAIRWFINSAAIYQDHFKAGTYYLFDKKAETWEKKNAASLLYLNGFDGWMVIPFNQFGITMEDIQNGFQNFEIFTHAMTEGDSWVDISFMIGESVVVHDAQKFADKYASKTEMAIAGVARNEMTDTTIPAIMANDCGSIALGGGLIAADGTTQKIVNIVKPNEKSDAISIKPAFDTFSKIKLQNDSLNYKIVPEEINNQVLDTLGVAFYLEVPETAPAKVGLTLEICEEGTEIFVNSPDAGYYTVTDGKMYEHYGVMEFRPGFKGYVILSYETFDFVFENSEVVDGMLFSPNFIDYFAFEFDPGTYPALNQTEIIIDDIMMWQDLEPFATALLKIQGSDKYEIIEVVNNFRNDDSGLPRYMANDGTGIELEEGIYSMSNVKLSLVEIPGTADTYVNIKIGKGNSNIMFENYGVYEDQDYDELDGINISEGITFTVDVPKTAPSIIGMDFEVLENNEDYLEYHVYDANKFYYTIDEKGTVTKVFGYLEFNPGFKGQVIIPFKNLYFDEDYSDYYDGELLNPESIEYFGFYFSTAYYAAIGGAEFGVDSFAYYDGYALDYIDAVWKQITKDGTIIPQNVKAAATAASLEARTIAVKANPASSEVAFPLLTVVSLAVLSSALIVISRKRREED